MSAWRRARHKRTWARIARAIALAFAPGFVACAAHAPPKPPCDTATIAAKLVECSIHVRECEPYPAPCEAERICFEWADRRQAECVQ